MIEKKFLAVALMLALALPQFGMARRGQGQYDEEARESERLEKQAAKQGPKERKTPIKNMAKGVKEAAVDAPANLVSGTAEGTATEAPLKGTIDGAREGSGMAMDSAVKGMVRVATLGLADPKKVDVEEPSADTNEYTKFRVNL